MVMPNLSMIQKEIARRQETKPGDVTGYDMLMATIAELGCAADDEIAMQAHAVLIAAFHDRLSVSLLFQEKLS